MVGSGQIPDGVYSHVHASLNIQDMYVDLYMREVQAVESRRIIHITSNFSEPLILHYRTPGANQFVVIGSSDSDIHVVPKYPKMKKKPKNEDFECLSATN